MLSREYEKTVQAVADLQDAIEACRNVADTIQLALYQGRISLFAAVILLHKLAIIEGDLVLQLYLAEAQKAFLAHLIKNS
ncbi:hypothetical protein [Paenibacillus sp. YN15]|uniref:hypothetical protein n=1 Tax=Paenibacillus sp. YN15 TaxID=1742774 RepID=UPI000DCBF8AC|nr:hypothetical protein [Paenibacillus sp. YN15]RAV02690.1 hypothetical protein DQG13_09310 [Paenibacillus sp. YN15]